MISLDEILYWVYGIVSFILFSISVFSTDREKRKQYMLYAIFFKLSSIAEKLILMS